ncbi:MAG: DUF11 domain-containing protein [Clostridiales Family XIII bacterium]|nr:DUF11 domain-containing protein [Clostridiales Family XIII bacterium]
MSLNGQTIGSAVLVPVPETQSGDGYTQYRVQVTFAPDLAISDAGTFLITIDFSYSVPETENGTEQTWTIGENFMVKGRVNVPPEAAEPEAAEPETAADPKTSETEEPAPAPEEAAAAAEPEQTSAAQEPSAQGAGISPLAGEISPLATTVLYRTRSTKYHWNTSAPGLPPEYTGNSPDPGYGNGDSYANPTYPVHGTTVNYFYTTGKQALYCFEPQNPYINTGAGYDISQTPAGPWGQTLTQEQRDMLAYVLVFGERTYRGGTTNSTESDEVLSYENSGVMDNQIATQLAVWLIGLGYYDEVNGSAQARSYLNAMIPDNGAAGFAPTAAIAQKARQLLRDAMNSVSVPAFASGSYKMTQSGGTYTVTITDENKALYKNGAVTAMGASLLAKLTAAGLSGTINSNNTVTITGDPGGGTSTTGGTIISLMGNTVNLSKARLFFLTSVRSNGYYRQAMITIDTSNLDTSYYVQIRLYRDLAGTIRITKSGPGATAGSVFFVYRTGYTTSPLNIGGAAGVTVSAAGTVTIAEDLPVSQSYTIYEITPANYRPSTGGTAWALAAGTLPAAVTAKLAAMPAGSKVYSRTVTDLNSANPTTLNPVVAVSNDLHYDAALRKWISGVTRAGSAVTPTAGTNPTTFAQDQTRQAAEVNPNSTTYASPVWNVLPGDVVTYTIKLYNQCQEALSITNVSDYLPAGLIFNAADNPGWSASGSLSGGRTLLTYTPSAPIALPAWNGVATSNFPSAVISVKLTVDAGVSGQIDNFAEITGMQNSNGDQTIIDKDSTRDANPDNDGTVKDNEINENGAGGNDQDDHDVASINVPTADLRVNKTGPGAEGAVFFVYGPSGAGPLNGASGVTTYNPGYTTIAAGLTILPSAESYTIYEVTPAVVRPYNTDGTVWALIETASAPAAVQAAATAGKRVYSRTVTVADMGTVTINVINDYPFDAALRKWVSAVSRDGGAVAPKASSGSATLSADQALQDGAVKAGASGTASPVWEVLPGDFVTYTLKLYNQCKEDLYVTNVSDYLPAGLIFDADDNPGWTAAGSLPGGRTLLTYTPADDPAFAATASFVNQAIYLPSWGGGANDDYPSVSIQIKLTVADTVTGQIDNFAEITAMEDENGDDAIIDKDSTRDDNPDNDGPVKDNEINENGDGGNDQDDHDVASITVPTANVHISKSGDGAVGSVFYLYNNRTKALINTGGTAITAGNMADATIATGIAYGSYTLYEVTDVSFAPTGSGWTRVTLSTPNIPAEIAAILTADTGTNAKRVYAKTVTLDSQTAGTISIVNEGIYDAALRKWVTAVSRGGSAVAPKASSGSATLSEDQALQDGAVKAGENGTASPVWEVLPGDLVTYTLKLYNQCKEDLYITNVSDYLPAGLIFDADDNPGWTSAGPDSLSGGRTLLTYTPADDPAFAATASFSHQAIYLPAWGGGANDDYPSVSIQIKLTVADTVTGQIDNFAEISGMENEDGNPDIVDKDSTPDDNPDNDGPVKDNEINENGDGGNDEDDQDVASVTVPTADVRISKSGDGAVGSVFYLYNNRTKALINTGGTEITSGNMTGVTIAAGIAYGSYTLYEVTDVSFAPAGSGWTKVTLSTPNIPAGIAAILTADAGTNAKKIYAKTVTLDSQTAGTVSIVNEGIYDAALRKWVTKVNGSAVTDANGAATGEPGTPGAGSAVVSVLPFDLVTYNIRLYNQCKEDLYITNVSDYYVPAELQFVTEDEDGNPLNTGWANTGTSTSGKLTYAPQTPIHLPAWDGTGPYPYETIEVTMQVLDVVGLIDNFAEISGMENEDGNPDIVDKDSTPDDNPDNDGSPKDNEINENGKHNFEDDEDDHDVATIKVPEDDVAVIKSGEGAVGSVFFLYDNRTGLLKNAGGTNITFANANKEVSLAKGIAFGTYTLYEVTDVSYAPTDTVLWQSVALGALTAGQQAVIDKLTAENGTMRAFKRTVYVPLSSTPISTVVSVSNECVYDAALRKWVAAIEHGPGTDHAKTVTVDNSAEGPGADVPVVPPTVYIGDYVDFAIHVFNQCEEDVYITNISDYLPKELAFVSETGYNSGWTNKGGGLLTYKPADDIAFTSANPNYSIVGGGSDAAIHLPAWSGEEGDAYPGYTIHVILKVLPSAALAESIVNFAEITKMTNEDDIPVKDKDSTPDDNPDNDGPPKDNEIDEDGKDGNDEDDHDLAEVIPTFFDAALIKWIGSVDRPLNGNDANTINAYTSDTPEVVPVPVQNGDKITFNIDLFNQCENPLRITKITDFIPQGLTFSEADNLVGGKALWTANGNVLSYNGGAIAFDAWDGVSASSYPTARVQLVLRAKGLADQQIVTNIAEITEITDNPPGTEDENDFIVVEDIDSVPDADKSNDGFIDYVDYDGEEPEGTVKDNETEEHRRLPNEDGGYTYDTTQDEDDHDFARVITIVYDAALQKWVSAAEADDSENGGGWIYKPVFPPEETGLGGLPNAILNEEPLPPVRVYPGHFAEYTIRVINQGGYPLKTPEIVDYIPEWLEWADNGGVTAAEMNPGWSYTPGDLDGAKHQQIIRYDWSDLGLEAAGGPVFYPNPNDFPDYYTPAREITLSDGTTIYVDPENPNQEEWLALYSRTITIKLRVKEDVAGVSLIRNFAEISKLTDDEDTPVNDEDSTPDDKNDEDTPDDHDNDINNPDDEDDHDWADVNPEPIQISVQVDKDTIEVTAAMYESLPGKEEYHNVGKDDERYRYDINFRNTSNVSAEEMIITDPLENSAVDQVYLEELWTPVVWGDTDGYYDVLYQTNKTSASAKAPVSTRDDGDDSKAAYSNKGWKLWPLHDANGALAENISTTVRCHLYASDIKLAAGEYITAIRFNYGSVKVGFTSLNDVWDSLNPERRDLTTGEIANLPKADRAKLQLLNTEGGEGNLSALGWLKSVFAPASVKPLAGPGIGENSIDWKPQQGDAFYNAEAAAAQGLRPASYLVSSVRAFDNENIVSSARAQIAREGMTDFDQDAVLTQEIGTFETSPEELDVGTIVGEDSFFEHARENGFDYKGGGDWTLPKGGGSPARTGDDTPIFAWIALMAGAAICVTLLILAYLSRRRRNSTEKGGANS